MKKSNWFGGLLFALPLVVLGCSRQEVEKADVRQLVRVCAVTNGVEFVDALHVQGTVRAKNTAAVSARLPGAIDEICVEEGARVKRGDLLFKVDQINLANAVRAAKDDCALAAAKLAQAIATEAKAKLDLERMTRLLAEGAVTRDAFERAEVAAKSHTAALDAAKATVTKSETGLAVAEKNLSDSEVRSPYDAVIIKKLKNAGDFVGAGMKVFELEDPSVYEICLSLNAAQYARVCVGKTELAVGDRRHVVTYKSPSVNQLTRTFEIRAVVPKVEAMVAGMIVEVDVVFARRRSQAVPTSAVALRGGGACVFAVVDGVARRIPVTAGLTAGGWREIVTPQLKPDDRLIAEGMLLVNEGESVRIADAAL